MCKDGEFGLLSRVASYISLIENKRNIEYLYKRYPDILTVKHVLNCDWMSYDHKVHMCNILFNDGEIPDAFSADIFRQSEQHNQLKSDLFYGDKYQDHKYG